MYVPEWEILEHVYVRMYMYMYLHVHMYVYLHKYYLNIADQHTCSNYVTVWINLQCHNTFGCG